MENQLTGALTPEQQKDVEKRTSLFLKEYGELTKKHEVDLIAYPVWMPNQTGAFETRIQISPLDRKHTPIKSPFIQEK